MKLRATPLKNAQTWEYAFTKAKQSLQLQKTLFQALPTAYAIKRRPLNQTPLSNVPKQKQRNFRMTNMELGVSTSCLYPLETEKNSSFHTMGISLYLKLF